MPKLKSDMKLGGLIKFIFPFLLRFPYKMIPNLSNLKELARTQTIFSTSMTRKKSK